MLDLVLIPALFAATIAIAATVAIERLGGRVGGILGTLPTTIVPASWGFAAAAETDAAFVAAMAAVPVGMGIDGVFLWMWRVLPGRLPDLTLGARLTAMVAISLGTWGLTAGLALAALDAAALPPLATGGAAMVALTAAGLAACWRPPPAPKGKRPVSVANLLARGALAGAAIAVSVAVAHSGFAVAAGLASVFPAIFMTAMVSLWVSQGEAVPIGAVGPMILGSTSVAAYALLGAWAMPALGVGLGSAVAWVCAVCLTSVPATAFLRSRRAALDP